MPNADATSPAPVGSRDPYCGNCGYALSGLTESSKCPECGKPLVEVLERGKLRLHNRRYRSATVVYGLPLIDIALGVGDGGKPGHARGIIAIGDVATGWLALGGFARGLIAFGGMAIGLVAFGGFAIGGIAAGGGTIGLLAVGGGAIGGLAFGGGAGGLVATGGGAYGYYARGGSAYGKHVISVSRRDQGAVDFFDKLDRVLLAGRSRTPLMRMSMAYVMAWFWLTAALVAVAAPAALAVWLAIRRQRMPSVR